MDTIKMGSFIREERKKQQLNQKQLAEALQVSTTTVCKWEKGVNVPDISNLEKLAAIFHVSIQEILNGDAPADVEKEQMEEGNEFVFHPGQNDTGSPSPVPAKPPASSAGKRYWKTGMAVLSAFFLVISTVFAFNSYMSQPRFSVIREFRLEPGDLGIYEKHYNSEDVFCIIVKYSGNAEDGDFDKYSTILHDRYYQYFDEFKMIAIAYFDNYDPQKDTFDSGSYQTLFFNTQDYD